jgi:hypothetical protein
MLKYLIFLYFSFKRKMVKISFTFTLYYGNVDVEEYVEDNNILQTTFYQDEEFFPESINTLEYGKYTITLSHLEKDIDEKIKEKDDDEIKTYIKNKYQKKIEKYQLKMLNFTMPPFSRQTFLLRIKFFIKSQNIDQSDIDRFAKEVITTYSGEKIERYKYLLQGAFENEFTVYDINYEDSVAIFHLMTDLNNINIVTKDDLLYDILHMYSFEDGLYGGGEFVYSKMSADVGGHYEYNLDFRRRENVTIVAL